MRLSTALSLLLAGLATAPVAHASERILTNGFDPCCTLGGDAAGLTPGATVTLHLAAGVTSEDLTLDRNGPWQLSRRLLPAPASRSP